MRSVPLSLKPIASFLPVLLLIAGGRTYADDRLRQMDLKVQSAVRFLQHLPPGSTLSHVEKMLPRDTAATRPAWETTEIGQGSYVRLSGKAEGILVFLGSRQRRMLRARPPQKLSPADKRWQPADSLDVAMYTLAEARDKRSTLEILKLVSKRLGKPKSRHYEAESGPDSGWQAEWELSNGRTVTLEEDSEVHLFLSFRYSVRP